MKENQKLLFLPQSVAFAELNNNVELKLKNKETEKNIIVACKIKIGSWLVAHGSSSQARTLVTLTVKTV